MKFRKSKSRGIIFSAKYVYIASWVLLILLSAYTIWFLNENFYKTIAQIRIIEPLREEVAPDIIDIDRVNRVINKINAKINATSTIDFANLESPFFQVPVQLPSEDIIEPQQPID